MSDYAFQAGMSRRLTRLVAILLVALFLVPGCSVRKMAMRSLSGSFEGALDAYTRDGDPEFVREAMPASLKMIEMLLVNSPENVSMLTAAASGFTLYSHAFLIQRADRIELKDLQGARELRHRGKEMHLRARDYGLRALEVRYPGFRSQLKSAPDEAVQQTGEKDIPLLYWTAASWGSAISVDTEDYELLLDLSKVERMIRRCLELDGSWGNGRLHEFMITFEAGRSAVGGSRKQAEKHFRQALKINNGQSAGTYVTAAEALAIPVQDRARFRSLLKQALEVDPDVNPDMRLANVLAQDRARWLLNHTEHFFY